MITSPIINPDVQQESSLTVDQDALLRHQRFLLLADSDWTQLPDAPLSPEAKEEWSVYRQALRDITDQPNFPEEVSWPTKPSL